VQQNHKSYHVCVSSTFMLPSTPSTIASYSLASQLGSVSMALSLTGLSPTCHLAPSVYTFPALYTSFCGVPQGSVLGVLLYVMYTTPLSTLISSLSLNYHRYAMSVSTSMSIAIFSVAQIVKLLQSPRKRVYG